MSKSRRRKRALSDGEDGHDTCKKRRKLGDLGGKRYCICREHDDGSHMVQCPDCEEWFHVRCIPYYSERQCRKMFIDEWTCPKETCNPSREQNSQPKTSAVAKKAATKHKKRTKKKRKSSPLPGAGTDDNSVSVHSKSDATAINDHDDDNDDIIGATGHAHDNDNDNDNGNNANMCSSDKENDDLIDGCDHDADTVTTVTTEDHDIPTEMETSFAGMMQDLNAFSGKVDRAMDVSHAVAEHYIRPQASHTHTLEERLQEMKTRHVAQTQLVQHMNVSNDKQLEIIGSYEDRMQNTTQTIRALRAVNEEQHAKDSAQVAKIEGLEHALKALRQKNASYAEQKQEAATTIQALTSLNEQQREAMEQQKATADAYVAKIERLQQESATLSSEVLALQQRQQQQQEQQQSAIANVASASAAKSEESQETQKTDDSDITQFEPSSSSQRNPEQQQTMSQVSMPVQLPPPIELEQEGESMSIELRGDNVVPVPGETVAESGSPSDWWQCIQCMMENEPHSNVCIVCQSQPE